MTTEEKKARELFGDKFVDAVNQEADRRRKLIIIKEKLEKDNKEEKDAKNNKG